MNNILPQDLRVFIHAARRANFAAAALELGASPAYVSKRIAMLEDTLKVKLFHRTTRHVAVTERGELMLSWAQRVLDVYDQLEGTLEETQVEIRGGLRIAASSGLGRNHVAPVLSELVKMHPGLEIDLEILDRSVDLVDEDIDIDVRVGDVREHHVIPHHLARGRRILCASPEYLRSRHEPESLADLSRHSRQRGARFQSRRRDQTVGSGGARHHAALVLGRRREPRTGRPLARAAQILAAGRRLGGDENSLGQFRKDQAVHSSSARPAALRTVRARGSRRRLRPRAA